MIKQLDNTQFFEIKNNNNEHSVNFEMIVKNKLLMTNAHLEPQNHSSLMRDYEIDNPILHKKNSLKCSDGTLSEKPDSTNVEGAILSFCISIMMMDMLNKKNYLDEDELF